MMRPATLLLVCLSVSFAVTQNVAAPPKKNDSDTRLTVAVLGFYARDRANPELGGQVSELLTAVLSDNEQLRLVDRTSLQNALAEAELSLAGLVADAEAVKVGKLVGARLIITGRAFSLGNKLYITAKIVGTETSLTKSVKVTGGTKDDIGELAIELAEQINEKMISSGQELAGVDLAIHDPVPALVDKLKKVKQKPTLAVVILEEHMAGPRPLAEPVDPAVETEVKKMLLEAGFTIKDVNENELAEWARDYGDEGKVGWPRDLDGVDLVVTGEAFSAFAARIRSLVSCTARAEINVISREEGKIVHVDRATMRAIDLAEHISGKTALQKAGHAIGVGLLTHLSEKSGGH
jgi:TolB-like protein